MLKLITKDIKINKVARAALQHVVLPKLTLMEVFCHDKEAEQSKVC